MPITIPDTHRSFEQTSAANTTAYIIGDDVLAQADGSLVADIDYLLYDGHGSTRQLSDNTGALTGDSFSYDAYGVMLAANPAEVLLWLRPMLSNMLQKTSLSSYDIVSFASMKSLCDNLREFEILRISAVSS